MGLTPLRALVICLAAGLAQVHAADVAVVNVPPTSYKELKGYLNLTDAQVQSLAAVEANRGAAQQAAYKQINEKELQLNALLKSGTTDALTVGQLQIEINNLKKQLQIPGGAFRASALAILSPEQAAKLNALVNVIQLQQLAWQAVTLDLIDAPPPANTPAPAATPPAAGVPAVVK